LAHVIRRGELVPVRPSHKVENADVMAYANALQDTARPLAEFRWLRGNTAIVRAMLDREDLLSVQVGWFNGWEATVGRQARPVFADGLGFVAIRPECEGNCEIALTWVGRPDLRVAAWISSCSLALLAALLFRDGLKRRRARGGRTTPGSPQQLQQPIAPSRAGV
jgi:hypothetical protein